MRYLFFLCILLLYSGAFAGPCHPSSPIGMQNATDNTPISSYLENTINISGIVIDPNVDVETNVACTYNALPCCFGFTVYSHSPENPDSTTECFGRVAALQNFKVDGEKKNAMSNAVDSSWIIYPEDLNLQIGDSLYIKNYSALYHFLFNETYHCDLPPRIYATGEYFVNPTEDILSTPRSRILKVEKPKFHNRDAGGRCVNDKKRNVIRY